MQIQLEEYRKLAQLQQDILNAWEQQQRAALQLRVQQLEEINQQLIE